MPIASSSMLSRWNSSSSPVDAVGDDDRLAVRRGPWPDSRACGPRCGRRRRTSRSSPGRTRAGPRTLADARLSSSLFGRALRAAWAASRICFLRACSSSDGDGVSCSSGHPFLPGRRKRRRSRRLNSHRRRCRQANRVAVREESATVATRPVGRWTTDLESFFGEDYLTCPNSRELPEPATRRHRTNPMNAPHHHRWLTTLLAAAAGWIAVCWPAGPARGQSPFANSSPRLIEKVTNGPPAMRRSASPARAQPLIHFNQRYAGRDRVRVHPPGNRERPHMRERPVHQAVLFDPRGVAGRAQGAAHHLVHARTGDGCTSARVDCVAR